MAFTADPTTDRGKVRLLVYDTTESGAAFTDADIDAFLELNSDSVLYAASDACRSLAARNAPSAYYLRLEGALSLDKKDIPKFFLNLATSFMQKASGGPDGVTEFIDSYAIDITNLGVDKSEYIED